MGSLVVCASLGATAIFANDWLQREWLSRKWLYRGPAALTWVGVFAVASIAASIWLCSSWRRGRWTSSSYAPLRWILPALVIAWCSLWTIDPPVLEYDGTLALAAAAALWTVGTAFLATPSGRSTPRWVRAVDVLVCEVAACALVAEIGLRLVRRATDLPLLATASTTPDAWIRAHRLPPGSFLHGFAVNREGFVDVEPEDAARRGRIVACIGDSFSVGVVPHHLHYTTVAETSFDDLEIYNVGVVNAGPREYLAMLETSALPLRPVAVVVALFVGNDIQDARRGAPTTLETWMDRDEVLILQIPRRLLALSRERAAGAAIANPGGSTRTGGLTTDVALSPAEAEKRMPWLADPLQELTALSPQRFLYVEGTRTEILFPEQRAAYDETFAYIEKMRELAGPTPIALLLIPDEYQVEDGLWEKLRAEQGLDGAERELPQKILGAWLEQRGIPYVDLLEKLRAVAPMGDGERHVYHLRDTHFNARGNKVAAEGLVELIERCGVQTR